MTHLAIHRPSTRGRKRRQPASVAASAQFAPGHFTALIREHNWPPRFVAVGVDERAERRRAQQVAAAQAARALGNSTGSGYGDGTIKGMGHKRRRPSEGSGRAED